MKGKFRLVSTVVLIMAVGSCSEPVSEYPEPIDFEALSGPYLGQAPPGDEPQLFLPGLITTHWSETYIAFLEDARACVYSTITDEGQRTFYTYEKDGRWTPPQRAPFEELHGHPNYTTGPEGKKVYFHSGRPTHPDDTRADDNIWTIEWTGDGWAEPTALPAPANSEYGEAYPTATTDGTVYFFSWRRPDTRAYDIYRSRFVDGEYKEAERLDWPINTDYSELDPYVAPDESFLIFGSGRPGGYGSSDNYICFRRDDGTWTAPANLGPKLNSPSGDICANGSSDGKYLFFSSGRKTDTWKGEKKDSTSDYDLYWVETSSVEGLRKTMLEKASAADVVLADYRTCGLQTAIDRFESLYAQEQDRYYFSPYELLSICERMINEGDVNEADRFHQTLLSYLPKELEMKLGLAQIYAMNGYISGTIERLKELAEEDPAFDLEDNLATLGYLLTQYPEKADDALKILEFTVEEFPDSAFVYYSLARLYSDRGDIDEAVRHCKKCLELEPNNGDAASMLERLEKQ
jgi:tetratricopeptide (TPR) repeat protein